MADFRHGLCKVADNCKSLKAVEFSFDYKKELMTAVLRFPKYSFVCIYDWRAEIKDSEVTIQKFDTVKNDDQTMSIMTCATSCGCSGLWQYVKSFEPKLVVVKKKKVN